MWEEEERPNTKELKNLFDGARGIRCSLCLSN